VVVFINFKSVESEDRFKKWILKGNEKASGLGAGALGLHARTLKIGPAKYVFSWEHYFLVNMSLFLRFMLWVQFRRVRKDVDIKLAKKLELVNILMTKGVKHE